MTSPDPASVYVDVAHKFENEEEYSILEAINDFKLVHIALGATLRTIQNLEAQIRSQEAVNDEQKVEILLQSIDLFDLKSEINEIKGQNDDS